MGNIVPRKKSCPVVPADSVVDLHCGQEFRERGGIENLSGK